MTPPKPYSVLDDSLREEQRTAVDAAYDHLVAAVAKGVRGNAGSLLLVSPTGTGKSFVMGALHRRLKEDKYRLRVYTTFPSNEIAYGVFVKTYGEDYVFGVVGGRQLTAALESHGFWTIKRLHNELVAGRIPLPDVLIHDEAHHSVDNTHEVVHGICGLCPRVGLTATDYRGTATETALLRERWPRSHRVLTLKNAVGLGRLSQPSWDVWPLLNDEQIAVVGGEFKVSSVESMIKDKLEDLIDRVRRYWNGVGYDRPTMIAVPGVKAVEEVVTALTRVGLGAMGVTGETKDVVRQQAFAACVARHAILVQIRVVGEGVDLPIRRLIDLSPTMSPVLWMQRVGRITRPVPDGELPPEYIACCHNLARHAYLWHGVIPSSVIRTAFEVWGKDFKPSRRFLARAMDIEGIGRFQPAAIPFADGSLGTMYAMQTKDGLSQFAIVLHPLRPEPWFFGRTIPLTGERVKKEVSPGVVVEYNEKAYDDPRAKWKEIAALPELTGMQTIKPTRLTDPQMAWWKGPRGAKRFGLDPEAEITNREFQILPVLANSGTRLNPEE